MSASNLSNPAIKEFSFDVRIGFGDCDPAGIVYFPNFYRWTDMATHALWQSIGWPADRIEKEMNLLAWPLIECGAKFRSPATYNQILTIKSQVVEWAAKTFRLEHKVYRTEADGSVTFLLEIFEVRFMGQRLPGSYKLKAALIPEVLKAAFEPAA
jgi:4-hydroxybenzoyl-CoA thioesterase